jgi:hypothetical protein
LVALFVFSGIQIEFEPISRLQVLIESLFTLDRDMILFADLSAGIRIIPIFWFFDDLSFWNVKQN